MSTDGQIALTCQFSGTTTGTIKWYYEGEEVESDARMDSTENSATEWDYTFTLTDVNPEANAGTYKCELTFADTDQIDASTEVTVRKASIISSAGDVLESEIVSEDVLKVRCMIEADIVPTVVKWFKGDTQIVFDGTTNILNYNTVQLANSIKYMSNITLKSFAFTDAGDYTCKAEFGESDDIPESTVTVVFAAVETDSNGCIFVDYLSSTDSTISCTFRGMVAAESVKFILPNSEERAGVLGGLTTSTGVLSSQVGTYALTGVSNDIDGSYGCEFTLASGGTVTAQQQLTARSKLTDSRPVLL